MIIAIPGQALIPSNHPNGSPPPNTSLFAWKRESTTTHVSRVKSGTAIQLRVKATTSISPTVFAALRKRQYQDASHERASSCSLPIPPKIDESSIFFLYGRFSMRAIFGPTSNSWCCGKQLTLKLHYFIRLALAFSFCPLV